MIVIIKFIDPIRVNLTVKVPCSCQTSDAWRCARLQQLNGVIACRCQCHRYLFNDYRTSEVMLHTDKAPTVEHPVDGRALNGYLTFDGGPDFNLDNVASWEVIPGQDREQARTRKAQLLADLKVVEEAAAEEPGPDLMYLGDVTRLDAERLFPFLTGYP